MLPRSLPRRLRGAVLAACLMAAGLLYGQQTDDEPPALTASSWYLIEYAGGAVLAQTDAASRHEPGDLVKIMTAFTALDALSADGSALVLDAPVQVSDAAVRAGGARMFLEPGSEVSLGDVLRGIIVQSSNDAAVALAEHVAGTEQAFVERMNTLARSLGMRESRFLDTTGILEGQSISARDAALLAREMIARFPDQYHWYGQRDFTWRDVTRHSNNPLLWRDSSVDGLAAARHHNDGGYALVGSAERAGARLIAVVMGGKDPESRSEGGQALLDYGFRHFETHLLYRAGDSLGSVRVWMGAGNEVQLSVAEDFYVTIPRGRYGDLAAQMQLLSPLRAPLPAGTVVGEAQVLLDGDQLVSLPVVTLDTMEAGGFWRRLSDRVSLWWQ